MHLKLLANKYDHVLATCTPKVYNNIGQMYFDFHMHEKLLDLMLDLLQKDQLEENRKNVDLVEKATAHLRTIYKNHLAHENSDDLTFLNDLILFGTFSCDSITVYLQSLNSLVHARDEQTEIMQLLRELGCNNEEMKTFLKKALRLLSQEKADEKRLVLVLPEDLHERLEQFIDGFYKISKSLKELNYLANNSFEIDLAEGGLTAKKLEDLAYQACDKVYLIDDSGPYDNLRGGINELHETLKVAIAGLETGVYEKELDEEEYKIQKYMVNSPVAVAAESFKSSLLEAESMKFKLESKEEEIKEVKRGLKVKADELSECKLRISLAESKDELSECKLRISLAESKAEKNLELEEKNKKLAQANEELKSSSSKSEKYAVWIWKARLL